MGIWAVVLQILTLFLLTASGAYLRKKDVLTEPVIKGINLSVLTLAWPAMVLVSTQKSLSPELMGGFLRILGYGFVVMGFVSVLVLVVCRGRMDENKLPVFISLCAMPNSGFVGIPLVGAFYGDIGIAYLAAYIIAFNLVLWTIQLAIFGVQGSRVKAFLNPSVLAAVVAVGLFVFQIRIIEPFAGFLNQLAAITTPLSMLLLGARLGESLKISRLGDKSLVSVMLIRLIVFPLFSFVLMRLVGMTGIEMGVMVLAGALPCATATQMFAEKHHKDYLFAAQSVSLSLLLCLATIPFVLWVTGM